MNTQRLGRAARVWKNTLLRKAWLKRKFGSHEYHEELLTLHQQWYELIRQALSRPAVARDYPELYKFFRETAFKHLYRDPNSSHEDDDYDPSPEEWQRP